MSEVKKTETTEEHDDDFVQKNLKKHLLNQPVACTQELIKLLQAESKAATDAELKHWITMDVLKEKFDSIAKQE